MKYALGAPGAAVRVYAIFETLSEAEAQCQPGEVAVETAGGGPATVTPDGTALGPPLPASLDELKFEKWNAAKVKRDEKIDEGFNVPGIGPFDTDPVSRSNINGAVTGAVVAQMTGVPFSVPWKLADNTIFTVPDATTMIAIGVAVLGFVSACHEHSQSIGLAINAAADEAALSAIDIETGWPG